MPMKAAGQYLPLKRDGCDDICGALPVIYGTIVTIPGITDVPCSLVIRRPYRADDGCGTVPAIWRYGPDYLCGALRVSYGVA